MKIKIESSNTYDLSDKAVSKLEEVFIMHSVDEAFEELAPHVPRADRYEVWAAIQ